MLSIGPHSGAQTLPSPSFFFSLFTSTVYKPAPAQRPECRETASCCCCLLLVVTSHGLFVRRALAWPNRRHGHYCYTSSCSTASCVGARTPSRITPVHVRCVCVRVSMRVWRLLALRPAYLRDRHPLANRQRKAKCAPHSLFRSLLACSTRGSPARTLALCTSRPNL